MRIIYITAKNIGEAKKISSHLLEKKLVACTNIFPIESMYLWQGEIQEDAEFVVLLKTVNENFDKINEEIKKIHSYDTPAIYSWEVDKINKKYDEWITRNCK